MPGNAGSAREESSANRVISRLISEKQLLEALRDFVVKSCRNALWYHTHRSDHSAAGFPDVVAIIDHRLIFAELKRDGQEPTVAQRQWLEALAHCHTIEVYVWHSSDLDHARDLLSGAYVGPSLTAAVPMGERLRSARS